MKLIFKSKNRFFKRQVFSENINVNYNLIKEIFNSNFFYTKRIDLFFLETIYFFQIG